MEVVKETTKTNKEKAEAIRGVTGLAEVVVSLLGKVF